MNRKIVLAGGSGFLGQCTSDYLIQKGYKIIVLTRGTSSCSGVEQRVHWDGKNQGEWIADLEGADALINFSGKSIQCIHNDRNTRELLTSRLNPVRALHNALAKTNNPPSLFIQCGAIGYYGNTRNVCDESSPVGTGLLTDLAKTWEEEFFNVELPYTRKVLLRIGLPLTLKGGILPPLARITNMFLGGSAGSGKQYMSWIHINDFCRIIYRAINSDMQGVYNVTAPSPTSNADFMSSLRKVLKKPWSPPVPKPLVEFGARYFFRSEPGLIIEGTNCVPDKLLKEGFEFDFPYSDESLEDLLDS